MTEKKALTVFTKTGAALAKLKKAYGQVIFDMTEKEGLVAAKKARQAIRTLRTDLEKSRRLKKAPIIQKGKELDAEAATITMELLALEKPIDVQIKAEEGRIEAEKEKLQVAEALRIEGIKENITHLRNYASFDCEQTSQTVQVRIDSLLDEDIDERSYQEFIEDAMTAKLETLNTLKGDLQRAIDREEEARKVAAEREELAVLRKEKEERDAADAKQAAADESAIAKAAAEAAPVNEQKAEEQPLPEGTSPLTNDDPPPVPQKDFPGHLRIIDCIAIKFDVSLPVANVWLHTAHQELAKGML